MICGGSPCQDFSVAGKQVGAKWTCSDCGHEYNPLEAHWSARDKCPKCSSENIEKTRSSLLVEYLRIIRANKPNFGIYENVKNIVGKQFRNTTFKLFENELHEYGYNTYWSVLNAKDYCVPQNRERVYLIFIKRELDNGNFTFPKKIENNIRLKDIVETNVDDKYYLTDKQIESIYNWKAYQRPFKRICGKNSVCPTITARGAGEYHSGMVLYSNNLADDTNCEKDKSDSEVISYVKSLKPRVLTEREAFRIIGFSDEMFDKVVNAGISKREIYRQAGNSIVSDVLYYIFKELYSAMPYLFDNLKLGSYFSGIGSFEVALTRLYKEINTQ